MKLPWDRNYLKISFHVVVTALAILIGGLFVSNLNLLAGALGVFFKGFFHVFTPFSWPLQSRISWTLWWNAARNFIQNACPKGR